MSKESRLEKLMKETEHNRERIEKLEAEGTAQEETIKKQENEIIKTMKEKHQLENKLEASYEEARLLKAENEKLEDLLDMNITGITERMEKLTVENVDLENKLKIQADKFQEEKQELQDKFQEEKQELQDKFQEEKQELQNKENSLMEGKHTKFIKETKETLGFTRTLLKSMEYKVLDPVCPEYDRCCGKKIRLEEKSQRNMILNTEYEHSWFKLNFMTHNIPLVYKLKEYQQYFILQGRSVGTNVHLFIIQHNQENISEHQYITRLEVYGETKYVKRSKTVRVCPSGIGLEDARNQLYTLDISHQDLEKMCVGRIYVNFKVMQI